LGFEVAGFGYRGLGVGRRILIAFIPNGRWEMRRR